MDSYVAKVEMSPSRTRTRNIQTVAIEYSLFVLFRHWIEPIIFDPLLISSMSNSSLCSNDSKRLFEPPGIEIVRSGIPIYHAIIVVSEV